MQPETLAARRERGCATVREWAGAPFAAMAQSGHGRKVGGVGGEVQGAFLRRIQGFGLRKGQRFEVKGFGLGQTQYGRTAFFKTGQFQRSGCCGHAIELAPVQQHQPPRPGLGFFQQGAEARVVHDKDVFHPCQFQRHQRVAAGRAAHAHGPHKGHAAQLRGHAGCRKAGRRRVGGRKGDDRPWRGMRDGAPPKTQMAVALLAALAGGAFAKVHVGQRQPCFDCGAQVRGRGLVSGSGKGIPFREAHHITGQAVAMAEKAGNGLEDLTLGELQTLEPRVEVTVFAILEYAAAVSRRETPGGTGPRSVETQLEQMREWLGQILGKD